MLSDRVKVRFKHILAAYWYSNFSPLNIFILLALVLPCLLCLFRLATSITWRLVGDTSWYKVGFFVQNTSSVLLFVFLVYGAIAVWNTTDKFVVYVRGLSVITLLALSVFWANLLVKIKPIEVLINDIYGRSYYSGQISPAGFLALKKHLESTLLPPKTLIISSGGGDMFAGLAIAKLIRTYSLDVQVDYFCASSCANFVFPAGKTKWLGENAIVMYHGNFKQEKIQLLRDKLATIDDEFNQAVHDDLNDLTGVKTKEAVFKFENNSEGATPDNIKLVQEYIGLPKRILTSLEYIDLGAKLENEFYHNLGVDPLIGVYGQRGPYREIYTSYEYDGFYYSVEDMKALGIKNIRLKFRRWNPGKNKLFHSFYLVSLNKAIN